MADGAVTQPTQAATQFATQFDDVTDELDIWGFLLPANSNNPHIERINFFKWQPKYTIGRGPGNDIRFRRCLFVSTKHCTIEWDGDETSKSAVILTDTSTNGTFIDGVRVASERGARCKILTDGCEIAFGTYVGNVESRALDDYRFIFRHRACKAPAGGLDKLYDLQHMLGRGSFGTVMKALHREEGNWYAVKIMPANKLRKAVSDPSADAVTPDTIPNILKREIDIMQRLEHKNICQFKEVFYESQGISIVLELVKGGDLLGYLEKRRELPEPVAQRLTYQICDALAYVHGLGIAHRDLKPENILLTDDNPPVVKVADFGLAKVVDTMTALHTFCGTPVYLAPEIVNGSEGYDHVVDSWSVGVIVWAMLTMSTPFNVNPEATDVARRVQHHAIDWNMLEDYHVSEEGKDFIRRLLEYDPKKRMTLTEAREHPWLIHLHHALNSAARGTSELILDSQSEVPHQIIITPPSRSESQSLLPDASMMSVVSDRMALDTASVVMEDSTREKTPSFAMIDDTSSSQPLHDGGSSQSDGHPSPARLQRRVDVIRNALSMGIQLPAPSQEMQARAMAEHADLVEAAEAPPPVPTADAHVDNAGSPGTSNPARRARFKAEASRTSKRKAADLSSEPSPPPPDVAGAAGGADTGVAPPTDVAAQFAEFVEAATGSAHSLSRRGRGGANASPKRPPSKKARTQAVASSATDDEGSAAPVAALERRRSSRLASPTKPKPSRKS
ncbi:Pkinase-domain-containing protein [Lentinus tigrinus ALCF2SS1-7]|uniref:Pkinase-domain-containing protein n=1 Tax=Lentinus tigrinus ALCF2SS1-6 TaxID=1328759 RepID=A0A5C2RQX3_9APHY|nr:Pkinase-domain-containing protein [Lentinus tigrinus ALCF2SS1-6]RPD68124.1 Pkinase-domain-containing protein [Lentinus tigrinus ALCF2SS1-7]